VILLPVKKQEKVDVEPAFVLLYADLLEIRETKISS
jgi:hypothetical protein